MTLDEYKELAAGLTADNAPTVIGAMLDAVAVDLSALTKATEDNAEKDKRITELQDTNMKLFLSVTGKGAEGAKEEDEEKTPEQLRAELVNEIKKGDNKE